MATPAVDRDALVELLDGNPSVIVTLIDSFLNDCSDYMNAIRNAVENEDAEALEREAHGLKGAAGSLRASPSSEAAQALEEMGHAEDFTGAEAALGTLEAEIDRLKDELRALKRACQEATGRVD
ncbi:Hpt domain-containing protein [Salinibacter grassmerensis]|uniref:Hpt domain-containing protein n=1 Tax=Salinibacter grassmerensis TaxID=3040353 RepID=UPI0021E7627E|nr:Hpt domain-containing protein [Salinibacter grassmerensis]